MSESSGILATFGLDLKEFIAHLVNFSVVLLVMWRWVYRPLMKAMDERSATIQEGLKHAEIAMKDRASATEEREQMVREARAEAQGILDAAKVRAESVHREKLAQARTEIEKIIEEAKGQIAQERDAAFHSLKGDMARLVAAAVEKVVRGLGESEQRAILASVLKDVEKTL